MKKFFSMLDPLLNYVDGGKLFRQPFRVLYYLIGILTCLFCFASVIFAFDYIDGLNGGAYLFFFLEVLVLLAAGLFSLIYWIKRAEKVGQDMPENARFLAIPAVGSFLITLGEWFGLTLGLVAVLTGVLAAIFLPITGNGFEFFLIGLLYAVGGLIVGFIQILLSRLFGELILATGSIANDTRVIADNTKK